MEAASYDNILRDERIRLFDTAGLNEPSLSKNDYLTAIEQANLQRRSPKVLVAGESRGGKSSAIKLIAGKPLAQTDSPNVLIIGESGVGKSSVINLIAGEQLVDGSSSARGCTMEGAPYDTIIRDSRGIGHYICLFDTVGLNEPSLSKNDYLTAIEKALFLIRQLWRTGGIRLLIFCIRGGRITSVTQSNYHLFRYILCQNQVPVAFVITGMETEQPMDAWWIRNEHVFERANLFCDSHVCITATRGLNDIYDSQHKESQSAIHNMLWGHMSKTSWKPDRIYSWFIHLAGVLLAWVAKVTQRKRQRAGQARDLKVEELARHLEDKCRLSREQAEMTAREIWAKRMENVESDEEEDVNAWSWIDERFGPDSSHCISLPIFS